VAATGYTLLDVAGRLSMTEVAAAHAAFQRLGVPFDVVQVDEPHVRELLGRDLFLLRPDLHVFWRGNALPVDLQSLSRAAAGHIHANAVGDQTSVATRA